MGTDVPNLADRLKEMESLPGPRRIPRQLRHEQRVERESAVRWVPVPRRSRVFLRHGEGHGEFADLTLIAPLPPPRLV